MSAPAASTGQERKRHLAVGPSLFDAVSQWADAAIQLYHVHQTAFGLRDPAYPLPSDLSLLMDRQRKVAMLRHCGTCLVVIQDTSGTLVHGSVLLPYPGNAWPWDHDRLHVDDISDCLGLVFSHVKRPKDLLSIRRVCWTWHFVHDTDARVTARWRAIVAVIERRGWFRLTSIQRPCSLYAQYMFINARLIGLYVFRKHCDTMLVSLARAIFELRGQSCTVVFAGWLAEFGCARLPSGASVLIGPRGQFYSGSQTVPRQRISDSELISSYFTCTRLCESDLPWN
jgi:hypothetical protein